MRISGTVPWGVFLQDAMAKCPGGLLAEIKYDGERVQVHKNGDNFLFFSRSLKPVKDDKVRAQRCLPASR